MPDIAAVLERFGEPAVLCAGGAVTGILFGFFAQKSRFCLRSAAIEFARAKPGEKLAVWLLTFATAVMGVQVLLLAGALDVSGARQLSARGSLSGALAGGLLFGAGMIMTRGCASRLLILSANGNLRALLSGLVFAVSAQASLAGALSPLREAISAWWVVDGGASRDLLAVTHLGRVGGLVSAAAWLAAALWFAARSHGGRWKWIGGMGAGLAIPLAWWFTFTVSANSFQVVPVQAMSFSGPSAEWLMRVLKAPFPPVGFDTGLLPGVFAGSFIAAAIAGELRLEGFRDGHGMRRYIAGAVLMGFGAMLAGGCAVGAGLSGGAIFSLTAWITLFGMWAGAALTDRVLDGEQARTAPQPATAP